MSNQKQGGVKMDSKQISIFWSEADRLVSLAAKYSQKVSLKENLLDGAIAWKVQKPFYEYYGGNMSQLSRSIENCKSNLAIKSTHSTVPASNTV